MSVQSRPPAREKMFTDSANKKINQKKKKKKKEQRKPDLNPACWEQNQAGRDAGAEMELQSHGGL